MNHSDVSYSFGNKTCYSCDDYPLFFLCAEHSLLEEPSENVDERKNAQHKNTERAAEHPHGYDNTGDFEQIDNHADNSVCKESLDRLYIVCKTRYNGPAFMS